MWIVPSQNKNGGIRRDGKYEQRTRMVRMRKEGIILVPFQA